MTLSIKANNKYFTCECGKRCIVITKEERLAAFFTLFYHFSETCGVGLSIEDYNKLFGVKQ